jgi:hypothetical protein
MNRLQFLKRLLATLFGAAIAKPGNAKPFTERSRGEQGKELEKLDFDSAQPSLRYLLSATVAGQWYYDFPTVGGDLLGEDEDGTLRYSNRTEGSSRPTGVTLGSRQANPVGFENLSLRHTHPEHPAQLVLEPDNPYDHRAIAVYWNGYKMGYVPRKDNKVLYNLLKDGHTLQTKLRLQLNFEPEPDHLYTYDFENVYEMRIRVYLLESSVSKNA